MKAVTKIAGLCALLPLLAFAQNDTPRPDKDAFFNTVLGSVDESTSAALAATREDLQAQREAVKALRESGADQETVAAAVESLRADKRAFREEMRAIIEADEDLQTALEEARANGEIPDRPRRGRKGGDRDNAA